MKKFTHHHLFAFAILANLVAVSGYAAGSSGHPDQHGDEVAAGNNPSQYSGNVATSNNPSQHGGDSALANSTGQHPTQRR